MTASAPGTEGPSYLVRFDDVCPTMNWTVWDRLEPFILEHGIRPILAVVPDNQDPKLCVAPPSGAFWERMRSLQAAGWTMALHGYRHVYTTTSSGIVGLNARSEFAGVSEEHQLEQLQTGAAILRREGITASAWVAPAHSFDAATLRALKAIGIDVVSDGYAMYPYRDREGMLWVPQQVWAFARRPRGVWTVCLHINKWGSSETDAFLRQAREYRPAITDLPSVVTAYRYRRRTPGDVLWAARYRAMLRARRWLSIALRRQRRAAGDGSSGCSERLV